MSAPRIGVLQLGAANRRSVAIALERAGAVPFAVRCGEDLGEADGLVIPGVSNFGYVADALDRCGLRAPLREALAAAVPVLAICAGFQLLFEASEEAPQQSGLGYFGGTVRRVKGRRSQHMGWNRVVAASDADGALNGWAYFAHAYAPPAPCDGAVAWSDYGERFSSIARRGPMGVQFHPERSGRYGAALIGAFVARAAGSDAR